MPSFCLSPAARPLLLYDPNDAVPPCASLPGPQSVTRITLEAIENDSGNGKIKTVTEGGVELRFAKYQGPIAYLKGFYKA